MVVKETSIKDLLLIECKSFHDDRGYFFEAYNQRIWEQKGIDFKIAQTNISQSKKGVLRGLHLQNPPFAQQKLVRVLKGSVLDVAVDIRKGSPTYGKHFSCELSEYNKLALLIPEGFAHGFVSLENDTLFYYDCSQVYNKDSERSILWNDPAIDINWGIENPIISEKDAKATSFEDFRSEFTWNH